MKSIIVILFFGFGMLILLGCNNNKTEVPPLVTGSKDSINISAAAFKINEGWGYSIFLNGKLYIKQTIIPVIEGNKSFDSEADATKCAALVVAKLKAHQKPTLVIEDLKSLGVIK